MVVAHCRAAQTRRLCVIWREWNGLEEVGYVYWRVFIGYVIGYCRKIIGGPLRGPYHYPPGYTQPSRLRRSAMCYYHHAPPALFGGVWMSD